MMNDHSSRSHSMLTVYIDIESVRLTFIFDTREIKIHVYAKPQT